MTLTSQSDRFPSSRLHEPYRPLPSVHDDMVTADGSIRPHWTRFIAGLEGMSDAELAKRWRLAARLLHENGLTYTPTPPLNTPEGRGISISCRC